MERASRGMIKNGGVRMNRHCKIFRTLSRKCYNMISNVIRISALALVDRYGKRSVGEEIHFRHTMTM